MDADWQNDGKWRRMKVSTELLNEFFAVGLPTGITTDAPDDLAIIGLYEMRLAPGGYFTFIVRSGTFEPMPDTPMQEIPYVIYRYTKG